MKFAEEICLERLDNPPSHTDETLEDPTMQARILLRLQPDLFWFQGHFPEYTLLPGVTQLNWVMHYAKKMFHFTAVFKSMEVIKFQTPLFPNEVIELTLSWQPELQKLSFQYHSKGKLASSGKITLGQE